MLGSGMGTTSSMTAIEWQAFSHQTRSMPTVLREKGYRFFFYMADRYEPPHIHVNKQENAAKLWLDPVELAFNDGFREHELAEIVRIVNAHLDELIAAWYKSFGTKAR
jgi:hypothetical protein